MRRRTPTCTRAHSTSRARETPTPGNAGGGCEGGSPCDVASGYALARDVVAWALDHCGVAFDMGCGGGTVQSLDLRTGKRIRTASSPDNSSPSIHTVVKTDGAIAWVARNVDPNYYDVYRSDGRGTRHLERSPSVDPRSLTLRSSTIVWLDKGQRHFASLR